MPKRTSQTHPLLIAELPAASGVIGVTFCPGKKGRSVHGADWDRDLSADMAVIGAWGATAVVSLMESFEFEMLKVGDFSKAVERIGADWHHLPIVDVDVPDEVWERRWAYHGLVLRNRLRRGEKILIHCRGGLGRAGMVAARLLVELGATPERAMEQVRDVRTGAIETTEQEEYVEGCKVAEDDAHGDKVLGCLFGGAVGDAFGYPVEFKHLSKIIDKYGPKGISGPVLNEDGQWVVSDDTQMTLFTIEAAARAMAGGQEDVAGAINSAYLDWHKTQTVEFRVRKGVEGLMKFPELWELRHPGNTCLSALESGGNGSIANPINNSKGCGGVMRVAPLGTVRSLTPETGFTLGAQAAALTHGHPAGYWSAAALVAIVRRVVDGDSLVEATKAAITQLENVSSSGAASEVVSALRGALDDKVKHIGELGEGWVGEEALAMGVFAALRGKDMAEVLQIGANHDGDSDSTASIAGQIYGAMKGIDAVPYRWVMKLDVIEPLCLAASMLKRVA